MSFTQFSEFQYEKTSDTSEKIFMGGFQLQEDDELENMRVKISMSGVPNRTTNESFKLTVYSDNLLQNPLYASSVSLLENISNDDSLYGTTDSWLGWLRVDFGKQNLNKNIPYFLGGEFLNYTRTASFILGLLYDFPDSSYDNGANEFFNHPIAFQINGFR